MQFFVVRGKDKTFVFTNHDAALRCRRDLKLNHWFLYGCVAFKDWKDGEPIGRAAIGEKTANGEA